MGLKEKTANSIKWNTLATVATMVIGILQIAILTRLLDKSDFGLIAIASMVIAFTDIFAELGVTAALIHKQNISREEYSSVYWLNIGMSIIICALTMLGAPLVASFYEQTELVAIVRLLSLKIFFGAFGKMFQTIKTKNLEFEFISKVRVLTSVVGVITSSALAWLGFGVMSLVWGQLAQIIINQGIYAIAGMRQMRVMLHFSFSEVRDVLKIGGYQLGTQILDYIAARTDVFLIGKFFSMEELGVYNIAKELIIRPYTTINGISSSVFSATFAKIQSDVQLVIENFKKLIKTVTILSVPLYVILFIFADVIVSILYAPSFAEVAVYIRIMSLLGICSMITSQGGAVMIAYGRTDLGLFWTLIRIVLTTLVLLATASISLYALALGQTCLSAVSVFIYFFVVIKPMLKDISLGSYISSFGGITCSLVLIAAPFAIANMVYQIPIIIQILIGLIFVGLSYLYVSKVQKDIYNEVVYLLLKKKR